MLMCIVHLRLFADQLVVVNHQLCVYDIMIPGTRIGSKGFMGLTNGFKALATALKILTQLRSLNLCGK